ncbi:Kunitz/Bovine pancreatic trypsin inhibitor domain protein [Trichuris suis]|nr:Kunitz/Bovine pancreatic trypsin inhibitor domain protein [Trichuris suis]
MDFALDSIKPEQDDKAISNVITVKIYPPDDSNPRGYKNKSAFSVYIPNPLKQLEMLSKGTHDQETFPADLVEQPPKEGGRNHALEIDNHLVGSRCSLPRLAGYGIGRVERWYNDQKAGGCQKFFYSGYGGNQNNFLTKEDCVKNCTRQNQSTVPDVIIRVHLLSDNVQPTFPRTPMPSYNFMSAVAPMAPWPYTYQPPFVPQGPPASPLGTKEEQNTKVDIRTTGAPPLPPFVGRPNVNQGLPNLYVINQPKPWNTLSPRAVSTPTTNMQETRYPVMPTAGAPVQASVIMSGQTWPRGYQTSQVYGQQQNEMQNQYQQPYGPTVSTQPLASLGSGQQTVDASNQYQQTYASNSNQQFTAANANQQVHNVASQFPYLYGSTSNQQQGNYASWPTQPKVSSYETSVVQSAEANVKPVANNQNPWSYPSLLAKTLTEPLPKVDVKSDVQEVPSWPKPTLPTLPTSYQPSYGDMKTDLKPTLPQLSNVPISPLKPADLLAPANSLVLPSWQYTQTGMASGFSRSDPRCLEPKMISTQNMDGDGSLPRWTYDALRGQCEPVYGQPDGTFLNDFGSQLECRFYCLAFEMKHANGY